MIFKTADDSNIATLNFCPGARRIFYFKDIYLLEPHWCFKGQTPLLHYHTFTVSIWHDIFSLLHSFPSHHVVPMKFAFLIAFTGLESVLAHGILTTPVVEFDQSKMKTSFVATIPAAFPGKFNGSPDQNVKTFTAAFNAQKAKGFKTLKDLVHLHGAKCGNSLTNVAPKPIPADGHLVWQNPDTGEGFVPSHTGPCEAWINDKMVFHNDNCAGAFPAKTAARIPIDFSSCAGKQCMLEFYWLALHEPTWQIYKNCAPLQGNGGSTYVTPSPFPITPSLKPITPSNTAGYRSKCQGPRLNVDFYGSDIFSFEIDHGAKVKHCQQGCQAVTYCVGFTIVNNRCYLKSKTGDNAKPLPNAMSFTCEQV
jgi:hypothetical protein